MYQINVEVTGVAPLMQHRFPMPDLGELSKGGKKSTGAKDYTEEWRDYFYANSEGEIFQPSVHFESAMVKAATNFKVTGKRGKSYKELFLGNIFVEPLEILHGMKKPVDGEALTTDGDKPLYLDVRPVVVNRARVVRIRPTFKPGWKLQFTINVLDDQISPEIISDVLTLAGKTSGIGELRPRFGRFMVTRFALSK